MKTNRYIDPPSGWLYGFPRLDTFEPSSPDLTEEERQEERLQWFRANGYPQSLIDDGALAYCRSWTTDVE